MHEPIHPARRALIAGATCLVLAACGGGGGAGGDQWTYAPLPSVAPSAPASPGGSPGGSPAASAAGSPAASAAGSPAASAAGSPAASPGGSPAASAAGSPAASPGGSPAASAGQGRVIELTETAAVMIENGGQRATQLTVTEGEVITFRIVNAAGFEHNFYIGPPEALQANQVEGLPGVPTNTEGAQEFSYTVTADTVSLEFACTVLGHYGPMHGTFTVE